MPTGLLPWVPNDSVQMREMAHRSVPNWLELAAFIAASEWMSSWKEAGMANSG